MSKILLILLFGLFAQANPIDDKIQDELVWENTGSARLISDVMQLSLIASPFVAAAMTEKNDRGNNLIVVGLTTVTNQLITGGLKILTGRERPDHSNYKSFPSGHASSAMAGATMLCHFADKYTCALGVASAATVAYLRIAGPPLF